MSSRVLGYSKGPPILRPPELMPKNYVEDLMDLTPIFGAIYRCYKRPVYIGKP